ncbi:MAG: hypothetical protein M0Q21_10785 [Ignavibacteriaceae bacterium]|nr:hypothetical protein [Ignavibacteriaceae bacterium]
MAYKKVTVTNEGSTGRNEKFCDNSKNKNMTRTEFVKEIKKGNYPDYHVRKINGKDTPVSNPDDSENNNLG